jgi:hypothetical protein
MCNDRQADIVPEFSGVDQGLALCKARAALRQLSANLMNLRQTQTTN